MGNNVTPPVGNYVLTSRPQLGNYVIADTPAPFTDQLQLAVAAYLARFKGSSREHTESDLRSFLTWCAERGLDPLAARRPHLELYIRWMQEIRLPGSREVWYPHVRPAAMSGWVRRWPQGGSGCIVTWFVTGFRGHSPGGETHGN